MIKKLIKLDDGNVYEIEFSEVRIIEGYFNFYQKDSLLPGIFIPEKRIVYMISENAIKYFKPLVDVV